MFHYKPTPRSLNFTDKLLLKEEDMLEDNSRDIY